MNMRYIGICKHCKDKIYSEGIQNYVVIKKDKKFLIYCSLYCFENDYNLTHYRKIKFED